MPEVESSVIARVTHDAQTQVLLITFRSGLTYRYEGVPDIKYDALLGASSKGTFFNAHIKDCYPFEQVTVPRARGR